MGGCSGDPVFPLAMLYELERGPRGVLYRARDARSGLQVTLRVPPPFWPREATLLAASKAGGLDHPHIVEVLESGWLDGVAYIILGEALGARVNPAALTLHDAVVVARDVATAVAYAAGRGLHHPGLIPDLLRFTPEGRVLVTGYELACVPDGPDLYLAPEVRKGAAVDAAANVYSLGALLAVLVEGAWRETAVPEELGALIGDAMRADPGRRPSAASLAAELTRWLDDQDAPPLPVPERHTWRDALVVAGLLALLSLGLAWPIPAASAPEPPVTARAALPETEPRSAARVEPPAPAPEVEVEEILSEPEEPPKAVELPPPARVGAVRHVHRLYGVFVALEPASRVDVGDTLEAVRDGRVVAVLQVRQLSRPEKLYPHGAAVCEASEPVVEAGQIVRRRPAP